MTSLYFPSPLAGILKHLLAWTVEHAVQRKQFGHQLKDFALIKQKFAGMALTIYAMESMAYLTAGMLDGRQNPDCSVEAAIVKVKGGRRVCLWCSIDREVKSVLQKYK